MIRSARRLGALAELLRRQGSEITDFIAEELPGENLSLWDAMRSAERSGVRLRIENALTAPVARAVLRKLEDHIKATAVLGDEICSMGVEAATIYRNDLALAPLAVRTRARDLALDRACWRIAEWIRLHRDVARARRSSQWLWDAVAECLEWHGHDLSGYRDKAEAVKKRAARFAKLVAANQAERERLRTG